MDRKFITKSIKETKQIAGKVAQSIIQIEEEKNEIGAVILALNGELGSGKTVFAQGFAQKLEIKEPILSPTFVIFRKFKSEIESRQAPYMKVAPGFSIGAQR